LSKYSEVRTNAQNAVR